MLSTILLYVPQQLVNIIIMYSNFYDYIIGFHNIKHEINILFQNHHHNKHSILHEINFDKKMCFFYKDDFEFLYEIIKKMSNVKPNNNDEFKDLQKQYCICDEEYMKKIIYLQKNNDSIIVQRFLNNKDSYKLGIRLLNMLFGTIDGNHYEVIKNAIKNLIHEDDIDICIKYACNYAHIDIVKLLISHSVTRYKLSNCISMSNTDFTEKWKQYFNWAQNNSNKDVLKYVSEYMLAEGYNLPTEQNIIQKTFDTLYKMFVIKK
jgi:hypothetical protein